MIDIYKAIYSKIGAQDIHQDLYYNGQILSICNDIAYYRIPRDAFIHLKFMGLGGMKKNLFYFPKFECEYCKNDQKTEKDLILHLETHQC